MAFCDLLVNRPYMAFYGNIFGSRGRGRPFDSKFGCNTGELLGNGPKQVLSRQLTELTSWHADR